MLKAIMISKLLILLFLQNYDVFSDLIYLLTTPLVNESLMYPLLIVSLLAAPMVICVFAFGLKSKEVGFGEFFGNTYVNRIKEIWR
jgi:hypothetical protein